MDVEAEGAELDQALDAARGHGVPIKALAPGVIDKVADALAPQGCIACCRSVPSSLEGLALRGPLMVLEDVRDPGNLGAVIRVADAAGFEAVLLAGTSTDPFGPKALRGSTGSTFRMPVIEAGPLDDLLATLAERGVATVGTSSHGGKDFASIDWPAPMALLFGNEASGLSSSALDVCSDLVMIPLADGVESLNLAVSAGILAFTVQRDLKGTVVPADGSTMSAMEAGNDR